MRVQHVQDGLTDGIETPARLDSGRLPSVHPPPPTHAIPTHHPQPYMSAEIEAVEAEETERKLLNP